VQDVWPNSDPTPYLVSVKDPYDTLSPYHDWGPLKISGLQLGKPPARQAMPFLGNLIEANCTLHGCHWLPPGTRQFGVRSTTTENFTKTTAYSWSTHELRFVYVPQTVRI
jgi:hypothetical protein